MAHQGQHFRTLQIDTLKVGRAWVIKEAFADFWKYRYIASARKFFDRWYFWATHSRFTNATIQLPTKANARGYRNFAQYRIAIIFHRGKLDLYPAGCSS